MAKVTVDSFGGLRPAASELRLAVHEAVVASNVNLRRALLAPRVRQLAWNGADDPMLPITNEVTSWQLLLHLDDVGTAPPTDATGNNTPAYTSAGSTQQATTKKFGAAALDLSGGFVQINDPSFDLDAATQWSVEGWVYVSSTTANSHGAAIIKHWDYNVLAGTQRAIFGVLPSVIGTSSVRIASFVWNDGTNHQLNSGTSLPTNQWVHLCLCRDGGTIRMFQDGALVATATGVTTTNFGFSDDLIDMCSTTGNPPGFTPYFDEIRVVVGEALFTGAFTPPTSAYDIADTAGELATTIFRFIRESDSDQFWLHWEDYVDIVGSPVAYVGADDQRHYYTGDAAGNGAPKMFTGASIDDSTPPYGGLPDTKYPYSWFYLGVPAPSTAPTITADEYTPPDTGVSGEITSLETDDLYVRIDKWNKRKSINNDSAQNSNIYDVDAIGVALQALLPGTRLVVATVPNANTVTVNGHTGDTAYKIQSADYGFAWASTSGRPLYTSKYQWNFYVPNGATLTSTAHELQVGDIIRITATAVPLQYNTTAIMNVNNADKTNDNVSVYQRINPTTGDIEFTGSISYVIERGGETIDPGSTEVVPVETETRSYVYTMVTHLGEEGPPSPPSTPVTIVVGDPVTLSAFATAPTDHRVITHRRIYRASTGTEGTEFQFVAEIPVATTTYEDTLAADELGELLPSETWDPPPADLVGIRAMPIGCCVGFFENVVAFSEQAFGHAWPTDYQYALEFDVVAVEPIQQMIVILTTGNPFVGAGSHPRQMSFRRTAVRHPCMDKRAVVNTGDAVIYPAPTGLIRISPSSAEVLTSALYTKEVWEQVVGPENATNRVLRAWFFDDHYILHAQYTLGGDDYDTRLVFDLQSKEAPRITSFTETIEAGFYDPAAGEFLFVPLATDMDHYPTIISTSLPADNRPILRWGYMSPDTDPANEYAVGAWSSKTFPLERPLNPAAARIVCRRKNVNGEYDSHALVRVNIYGVQYGVWDTATETYVDETVLLADASVIAGTPGSGGWDGEHRSAPFRIPVNMLCDALRIEFEVEGPVEVEAVNIAESFGELMETP